MPGTEFGLGLRIWAGEGGFGWDFAAGGAFWGKTCGNYGVLQKKVCFSDFFLTWGDLVL